MTRDSAVIGNRYKSLVNDIANREGCEYEILAKYTNTCKVVLWENGVKGTTTWNDIPYDVLTPSDIN